MVVIDDNYRVKESTKLIQSALDGSHPARQVLTDRDYLISALVILSGAENARMYAEKEVNYEQG